MIKVNVDNNQKTPEVEVGQVRYNEDKSLIVMITDSWFEEDRFDAIVLRSSCENNDKEFGRDSFSRDKESIFIIYPYVAREAEINIKL